MIINKINFIHFTKRGYTCLVERYVKPKLVKKNVDIRKIKLNSNHYHYKFVDCLHSKPWGEMNLILTQYVEGNIFKISCVSHKTIGSFSSFYFF